MNHTNADLDALCREAMADVDAGRVVDHQVVQAWADSLPTDEPPLTEANGVTP